MLLNLLLLAAVPLLYGLAVLFRVKEVSKVKNYIRPLSTAGGMFGASFVTNMIAISLGSLAYVTTVRSSVVMGALPGIMYFKESLTLPKAAALILIAAGSVIVGLY